MTKVQGSECDGNIWGRNNRDGTSSEGRFIISRQQLRFLFVLVLPMTWMAAEEEGKGRRAGSLIVDGQMGL